MTVARLAVLLCVLAAPAAGQIAVPSLGGTVGEAVSTLPREITRLGNTVTDGLQSATALAQGRIERIDALIRRNSRSIERDGKGEAARLGELLIVDPTTANLTATNSAGYATIEQGEIDGTGVRFARLAVPAGISLARAERDLKRKFPAIIFSPDHLHFASSVQLSARDVTQGSTASAFKTGGTVGLIDGGVDSGIAVVQARGFASGAPAASQHGTAVASSLVFAGVGRIVAADVYGRDPAGGNALAVARALGWMTALRVPVVTISLVGPNNPLLARTIAAASARGTIVVAAVGNDGPAAPPPYPASYPDVVAVTGVDGQNRALIEAGRALHLDYAAPGADIFVTGLAGRTMKARGTSFAAPLVAARIAAAYAAAPDRRTLFHQIDSAAIDLGRKGPDLLYGRGLVCGDCRRTK